MQKILVTGGAGFIGSNFIDYFLLENKNTKIINIDDLTYAGSLDNLKAIENNDNYTFEKGDVCDRTFIEAIFEENKITDVIHFAAESHVDNSIKHPDKFIQTNINGTFTILDVAKNFWMNSDFSYKPKFKNSRFHHISTDEVYGTLGETGLFTERTPYAPNSPYSASKASSDFLVQSYFHTYKMNVVTTNCSNNYGPKQHDEKLIPVIIRKAIKGEKIPIYGDGKNVRDWLFVIDHCMGIELVFKNGKAGERYNIGGENEKTNLEVAHIICDILDEIQPKSTSYKEQISFVKDRAGHDFRYAIDASKIEDDLGWKADENFETGIKKTINWYLDKYKNS